MNQPLWRPSEKRVAATNISRFINVVNQQHDLSIKTYNELHAYSINEQEQFWSDVWNFCGVKAEKQGNNVFYSLTNPKISDAFEIMKQILQDQLAETEKLYKSISEG